MRPGYRQKLPSTRCVEGRVTGFDKLQIAIQVLTLAVIWLTWRVYQRQLETMNRHREASELEISARLRPWVGLLDFGYEPGSPPENSAGTLLLQLNNVGALPAQRARLVLLIQPENLAHGDEPIRWEEPQLKALMPGEDGNYRIDLSPYAQFAAWRRSARDVRVRGTMNYFLNAAGFQTVFEGFFRFSEGTDALGRVKTKWRNQEVI